MSKAKSKSDYYCYHCESYFIPTDIQKPSCKFCQSTFVECMKKNDLQLNYYDDYDDFDNDMYKIGKCSRSRNEKYVSRHTPKCNNNLISMGSKVFLARNMDESYVLPAESSTSTSLPKVIADHQIDSLPTWDTTTCSNFGDSCLICSCDFTEMGDIVKTLYCGHQFHRLCLRDWLSRKQECPVCRHLVIFQNCDSNNTKRSFLSVVVNGNRGKNSLPEKKSSTDHETSQDNLS